VQIKLSLQRRRSEQRQVTKIDKMSKRN